MDSQPYYGPDEPSTTIQLERMFVAGDFICGVGYGVQVVLYVTCVLYLWRTRRSRGRQSLLLLSYMTLLLIVETLFCIVQARTVQNIYIDNRNYPGGPWQYFLATQFLPINVMFYATLFVLTFLADLLVLWRCWVIWSGSGRTIGFLVISFPALMILASFVMGTLWTLQSSQPGLSLYSALPMAYGTSYYAISLSVNILLTILITARLLFYRRRAGSIHVGSSVPGGLTVDHGSHYFSLATIFVESAALYSVFALIFIITYAINDPLNQIFLGVASAAQQIAGYLIIYRVAEGRAWGQGTTAATQDKLQTMNFVGGGNMNSQLDSSVTEGGLPSGSSWGTPFRFSKFEEAESPVNDHSESMLMAEKKTTTNVKVSKAMESDKAHAGSPSGDDMGYNAV